jgi:hypothetical protein
MATFDQLTAEQRAIIELVVRRGRSYESLADVLAISPVRVRELARDALAELAPVTAQRVDQDWRAQLADYLLGQQTGPESTATRGHLKRSEAARAWALSLLDSLDSLYGNGSRPVIPEADASNGRGPAAAAEVERPRERERKRAAERERAERERAERDRERERDRDREPARERKRTREPAAELSPEARRAVRRRRIGGAILMAVLAAGIVVGVLAATGTIFSSSGKRHAAAQARVQALGLIPLTPGSGSSGNGAALLLKRGSQYGLVVQASGLKPAPTGSGYAYAVWLYNSQNDLAALGAQVTDAQGRYTGQGVLPANFQRFKYIDVTYEKLGPNVGHNGPSVLRGAFANMQAPPAQGSQGTQTTPTTPGSTTPGPTP